MDQQETSVYVTQFLLTLCDHIAPYFPHYASAVRSEIHGHKMTNERWNRVTTMLASLAAVPGNSFTDSEHESRRPALSAMAVTKKMASVTFGAGNVNVELAIELIIFRVDEISKDIGLSNG